MNKAAYIVIGVDNEGHKDVLRRLGIEVNNAMNGVYLPSSMHTGLHTIEYYDYVNYMMRDVTSYSEFTEAVRKIIEWIVTN